MLVCLPHKCRVTLLRNVAYRYDRIQSNSTAVPELSRYYVGIDSEQRKTRFKLPSNHRPSPMMAGGQTGNLCSRYSIKAAKKLPNCLPSPSFISIRRRRSVFPLDLRSPRSYRRPDLSLPRSSYCPFLSLNGLHSLWYNLLQWRPQPAAVTSSSIRRRLMLSDQLKIVRRRWRRRLRRLHKQWESSSRKNQGVIHIRS